MKGVDVSSHQGLIDWAKVKAAGIEFAVVRAGYGQYSTQVDAKAHQNFFGALGAGLHVGAYWFSYATTPEEAKAEADLCADTIEKYKGQLDFPVYFDYEYDSEIYSKQKGIIPTQSLRESTNLSLEKSRPLKPKTHKAHSFQAWTIQ